jgi:RNA polymerase sigma factor (TIGR02999 family)
MDAGPGEITALLARVSGGDAEAQSRLAPLVYGELRRLAAHYMRRERPDHTLQPTAVVHEAYIRLVQQKDANWQGRAHFFAIASRMMRNILVDHARNANAGKRGGRCHKVPLDAALVYAEDQSDQLLMVNEALDRLAQWDPRQCRIVEMRFFGGLSNEEVAEVLGISARTVKREWSVARAWLYGELTGGSAGDRGTMEPD